MPICQPCRMPHNAAVCEDTLAGQDGYGPGLFLPAQALQLGRVRAGCGRRGNAAGTGVRRIGHRHTHHVCRCRRGRYAPAEEGKTMMSTTRSQAKAGRCNGWGQG